jgi:hypothetical protein
MRGNETTAESSETDSEIDIAVNQYQLLTSTIVHLYLTLIILQH